jgi:glycerol-3-phosphate dehydrogenase
MNVALAMTAACYGATVANHCEVTSLTKNEKGEVNGAKMRDNINGDEWEVRAKVILT